MSPAELGDVSDRYISKRNTKLTDLMMCPIHRAKKKKRKKKKEHLILATCCEKQDV